VSVAIGTLMCVCCYKNLCVSVAIGTLMCVSVTTAPTHGPMPLLFPLTVDTNWRLCTRYYVCVCDYTVWSTTCADGLTEWNYVSTFLDCKGSRHAAAGSGQFARKQLQKQILHVIFKVAPELLQLMS